MHKNKRGTTTVARVIDRLWNKEKERSGEEFDLTELARRVKMNQPTLYRLYRGEISNPKKQTVQPLLDYFEITYQQLTEDVDGEERKDDLPSARAKAIAKKFDALPQRAKQVVADLVEILQEQDTKPATNVIRLPRK